MWSLPTGPVQWITFFVGLSLPWFNDILNHWYSCGNSCISSCALKKIQKDCNNDTNCRNENTRFVDVIKRLQTMVQNNEITNNEAMFRYYNLIDYEESKSKIKRNADFSNYHYYPYSYYFPGMTSCYFSRTGFCY